MRTASSFGARQFVDEMRNIGSGKAQSQLLPAQAQAIDPFVRHRAEIGRVSVRFLAAHEVRGRIRQLPVLLPEMGKDEAFDLPGSLRHVQSMNRGVLRAVKNRAENAEHAREKKLAWRLLPQAVARRAANNCVDG